MSVDDEKLMAFVDGELAGAEHAEIEAALEHDVGLRAKVEAHRAMRSRLSGAFDSALSEPVPEQLLAAATKRGADVVNLAERRAFKWSAREFGAMAASVALGLVIGVGVMQAPPQPMLAPTSNGLVAGGALDRALNTQLASDQAGAVRIGVSFRDQEGDYCRTFDLTEGGASGLACRENSSWTIQLMSDSSAAAKSAKPAPHRKC